MNTGNLHFTKYIRVIMLILLSLWCKEGVGQTFDAYPGATKVIHKYQKYDNLVCDLTGEMNDILAELGYTQASDMDNNGGYIRWSAINADGVNANNLGTNVYGAPSGTITLFYGGSAEWWAGTYTKMTSYAYYWYNGLSSFQENGSKYLNVSLNLAWGETMQSTFSGYSVSCYIANEPFNTSANTEPQIDIQYVFHFNETGTSPIDPFENTSSISQTLEQTETFYEVSSPANISITLNDATAPSYIRWYFADASGNAVANPGFTLSNEGYTYTSYDNSIYYGGTTTDAVDALLNITVTPQSGMSWSDLTSYKLVALLSNEAGTVTDGTLTQEPLIATKYEISFDYVTFASALPDNQHSLDIEVTGANAQTATISLSEQWEQIMSDLGAETVTYMKYYWLDGKIGSLTGNISFSEHSLAGMHWLKPTDTSFSIDILDFTASVASGVITDYKLVILLSDEAATYDENSTWVKEPTLQSMYTVSFYAPRTDFDGSLVSGGISKAVEVTYEYGATTVQVGDKTDSYSLVYDWGNNTNSIQSRFNYITQSGDGWSNNVYYPNYRRAYVRNKETKELLANQNEWLTWTKTEFDYDALFYNEQGEFWTKNYAQYRQGSSENNWEWAWFNGSPYTSLLAVTVNLPEGADLTFEDIEVVVILAKKDAERETHSSDVHTVDLGPDGYEVEYVYSFKKEGVAFENTISATEYKTISIYDGLTYENIPVDLGGTAPTYVRWSWSWDGNSVATTDWTFGNTAVAFSDYNGTKYHYAGTTPNAVLNQLTINSPTGTDAKTLPSTNLKLVALVSTKTADDGAILDASSNLIKEPVIDKKYIISFASVPFEKSNSIYNATKKDGNIHITDEQKNGTASVTVELDDNLPTILSTFYKSNATDLDAGFYLRWYIVDGNGNRVTDLTGWSLSSANSGVSYTKNNYGYYWYSALNASTKVSENTDLMNLVVQCPSGTDLTQYKAVCVMSANLSDATVIDNQLVSEPTWTLQYTYSFASLTFEGSTTNAHFLNETIRLEDANMSTATLSLPLSSVADYMNNEASSFYIRYYLTDKSGNRVALPDGVSITPTDNTITLTSNDYGHYWYSSTGIGSISDLGVAVVDANSTVDLRNYNVVAVMSSNAPLAVSEGVVTYEPREMEVVYTYELKKPVDNSFDGACTGVTDTITTVLPEGNTLISITLEDLYKDYGKNGSEGALRKFFSETPKYFRVYIRNKKTKEILENQEEWFSNPSPGYSIDESFYIETELGRFWTYLNLGYTTWPYAGFNDYACEGVLRVNVAEPANSVISLLDCEIVMILSSKSEREYDYTSTSKVITKGPEEHEVEYVFNFVSEKYLPFVHYKGVTERDWETVLSNPLLGKIENQFYDASTGEMSIVTDDIRQGTHEWTYEIYVEPGATKTLSLPLQNVFDSGNQLEPQGYFRWYDWNTDFESANVKPYDENNTLLEKRFYQKFDDEEFSRGWIAWWWGDSQKNATANNVAAVNFTAPMDDSWTGDIIACDVSKYIDGLNIVTENDQTSIDFIHEPTLSYRYKYVVRPASVIADAIDAAIAKGGVLENHGNVTIGIYSLENSDGYGGSYWNREGTTTLRLERNSVSNYYFNVEGIGRLQSTSLEWSIYNAVGDKITDLSPEMDNPTFCKLVYNPSLYRIGEFYSVKVYACANDMNGQKQSKEIACFNCKFLDNSYVMGFDDIPTSRTISYLEENYTRVGLISFDVEEGSTLDAPTNQLNNVNPMPFKWQRSHYGYCYGQLYESMAGQAFEYAGLGALHGDYRLVKSANFVSTDMTELWHVGNVLHDRTYETTEGKQHGYFLYIDASDESRPIANVEFEGEMCVGSTLVLSAAVANMTGATIKPQLIFKLYGIKTDINGNETERKLIHSFATCDFSSVKATETAIWYQTYAKVTLQTNSGVENYQQFLVSIDNYCDGTGGADYAIDDIRIYTQNSKVEVKQNSVLCADEAEYTEADIMIKHETLLAMMPSVDASKYPLPVYYRICDEKGNPLTGTDFYGTGMDEYGEVDFRYYFYDPQSDDANEKDMGGKTADWLAHHYQKDVNGNHYFVLNEKGQDFKLEAGKKFYISLALPTTDDDGEGYVPDEYTWGKPTDVCSMYSDPFQPLVQSLKLTVGTNGINRINVDCHKTKTDNNFAIAGILQVPDPVTGELVDIDDPKACHFDWIVEVKDEVSDAEEIKDALAAFRNKYGKQSDDTYYTSLPTEAPGDDVTEGFTKVHYETLQKAIENGKLYISASTDLVGPIYHVGNTYVITAIPLESKVTQSNGTTYEVCPEPMEVTVEARLNGPELNLGFSGIRYADAGLTYGADGLRVGLKQLQDMQSGKPLHLPINAYKQLEKNSETGVEEYVEYTTYDLTLDDFDVIVWDSNDPTWADYLCKNIDLYNTEDKPIYTIGKESVKHITNENRSVELQLHQYFHKMQLATEKVENPEEGTTQNEIYVVSEKNTNIEIKYHEGYWYKVKFRYSLTDEQNDYDLRNRCYGESYLTIKVVPEYATWGEGLPNNSNWLNDDNWRRSSKAELYKEVVNSDNYPVYDETTGLSNDKGYVPMSFTKVTILNDMQTPYPYLSELKRNVHTNLITEETLTNGDLSAATTNIQYDMMVVAEPTTCPYNQEKTNVYECEHFYGNICDEIYFKPRAQLRYQHYLTYEKAWVEMELSANKWTMLTSPFEQMYAGDFYVPAVEEGSLYPYGRQETEAFQNIMFNNKANEGGIYSRNGYPIYQRSWDKINSMVVTSENDALRDDYDAFIDYEWTTDVDVVATQWSHVYNDMTKLYEPGRGFSVRLHHTDQQEAYSTDENGNAIYKDKKALLRFPKADTEYTYYDHADDEGHRVSVDKSKHHRLAADGVATGMVEITPVANVNEENPYYMVGNPYMASVRMELFFNANPHLVKTYWVVSNGVPLSATEETGLGIIGPMQSFFVKAKDGGQVTDVLFSPAMTVSHLVSGAAEISDTDGEAGTISFTTRTTDAPMARTRVILSAEADNGFVDEEDVETLLDSNLEDVPMVYTVAGTQAAMVNRLNDLTLLPLGVFGKEGETVDVQVSGVDALSRMLYFYDASTGRQTLLEEGASLMLETNVHGRYFLTTRALEEVPEEDTDWLVRCYSLQRGELIVAAMPQDNLRQVRIYGVNGRQVVNDATAQGNVSAYALPAGIYVVEVITEQMSRPQVVKVVVK